MNSSYEAENLYTNSLVCHVAHYLAILRYNVIRKSACLLLCLTIYTMKL